MKHWTYYRLTDHNSNGKINTRLFDFIWDNDIQDALDYSEVLLKRNLS